MNEIPDPGAGPAGRPEAMTAHQLTEQARALLDRRRVQQARALLARALKEYPDSTGLLVEAARADLIDGANDEARDTLQRVLSLDPDHPDARWFLFNLELGSDRLEQAEALVLGLLRDWPESAQFYAGYARLMLRALMFPKARALALEALRRDPDSDDALRASALCDIVERPGANDSVALARLVASNPDDMYTMRLVVAALANASRDREAHALARELLRLQPDDPGLLELVRALRAQTHWSLLPLWPMLRWGWYGSIAMWIAALALLQTLRQVAPGAVGWVTLFLVVYIAYSWVWPPLLRRWINR